MAKMIEYALLLPKTGRPNIKYLCHVPFVRYFLPPLVRKIVHNTAGSAAASCFVAIPQLATWWRSLICLWTNRRSSVPRATMPPLVTEPLFCVVETQTTQRFVSVHLALAILTSHPVKLSHLKTFAFHPVFFLGGPRLPEHVERREEERLGCVASGHAESGRCRRRQGRGSRELLGVDNVGSILLVSESSWSRVASGRRGASTASRW